MERLLVQFFSLLSCSFPENNLALRFVCDLEKLVLMADGLWGRGAPWEVKKIENVLCAIQIIFFCSFLDNMWSHTFCSLFLWCFGSHFWSNVFLLVYFLPFFVFVVTWKRSSFEKESLGIYHLIRNVFKIGTEILIFEEHIKMCSSNGRISVSIFFFFTKCFLIFSFVKNSFLLFCRELKAVALLMGNLRGILLKSEENVKCIL